MVIMFWRRGGALSSSPAKKLRAAAGMSFKWWQVEHAFMQRNYAYQHHESLFRD